MVTVHMLVGIPGSGKSTYARDVLVTKYNCRIVTSDGIRQEHPDWPESEVWPEVYRRIAEDITNGKDVIYDATSPTPKVRARFFTRLQEIIPGVKFNVIAYYFPTPADICYQRIEKRNLIPGEHFFPLEALEGYATTITKPSLEEGFSDIVEVITF